MVVSPDFALTVSTSSTVLTEFNFDRAFHREFVDAGLMNRFTQGDRCRAREYAERIADRIAVIRDEAGGLPGVEGEFGQQAMDTLELCESAYRRIAELTPPDAEIDMLEDACFQAEDRLADG